MRKPPVIRTRPGKLPVESPMVMRARATTKSMPIQNIPESCIGNAWRHIMRKETDVTVLDTVWKGPYTTLDPGLT